MNAIESPSDAFPDSAEPITEEWLTRIGLTQEESPVNRRFLGRFGHIDHLLLGDADQQFGLLLCDIEEPIWTCELRWTDQPWHKALGFGAFRTRGDVRRLLRVLGVANPVSLSKD